MLILAVCLIFGGISLLVSLCFKGNISHCLNYHIWSIRIDTASKAIAEHLTSSEPKKRAQYTRRDL